MTPNDVARRKRIHEIIQQFCLMDDTFFSYFMENNIDGMQYILRIIMDKDDLVVKNLVSQKEVINIYGRNVRFDVFATDSQGKEYNFEVQNRNDGAIPQRARYNSGLLDYRYLQPNRNWNELPETYVIFITARDVLGKKKPIYHIDRYISETMTPFDDGAHIIYVNGENQSDTPLGHLMQDFKQSNPDKLHSKLLANRMKIIKSNSEEDADMCKLMEDFLKEYSGPMIKEAVDRAVASAEARGEARGKTIEKINTLRNLVLKGLLSINYLKASGDYTPEELAAISQ